MTPRLKNTDSSADWSAAPGLVMLVDDDSELRRSLRRMLEADGHSVLEAGSQHEARAKCCESAIDVVVLDLGLPDGSGLETLSQLHTAQPAVAVIILTGSADSRNVSEALRLGASSYLRKPVDALTFTAQVQFALAQMRDGSAEHAARQALESHLDRTSLMLDELPRNLAHQLSRAWDLRHVETGAHVRRIAEFTERLALHLTLPRDEAEFLGRASMLHDLGKIAIPDAILNKPGPLTDEEFTVMKRHSELGAELLSGLQHPFLDLAARIARSHHERWNGSGYPDGLVGVECDRASRIVGVVDVYDALSQSRCYKEAWPEAAILEYFRRQRGKLFDAEVVDAFLELAPEFRRVMGDLPDSAPNLPVAVTQRA